MKKIRIFCSNHRREVILGIVGIVILIFLISRLTSCSSSKRKLNLDSQSYTATNEKSTTDEVNETESTTGEYEECCKYHDVSCGTTLDEEGDVVYCCEECDNILIGHNAECGTRFEESEEIYYCSEQCPLINVQDCGCDSHNVYCGCSDETGALHFCCSNCARLCIAPTVNINGNDNVIGAVNIITIFGPYEGDISVVNAPTQRDNGVVNNTNSTQGQKNTSSSGKNGEEETTVEKTTDSTKPASTHKTTSTSTPKATSTPTTTQKPASTPTPEPTPTPTSTPEPAVSSKPQQAPNLGGGSKASGGSKANGGTTSRRNKPVISFAGNNNGANSQVNFSILNWDSDCRVSVSGGEAQKLSASGGVYHGSVIISGDTTIKVTVTRDGERVASASERYTLDD